MAFRYIEACHEKGRRYACTPFLKYDVRLQRCWILCWRLDFRKGKDGNEFQPFAVQFAKKCFELIKKHYKFQSNTDLIKALSHVYDQIEDHKAGDEWTTRHHAILYAWMGDKQCAVTRYRDLLKEMGDKYYIWQEMAQFIDEASLRVGFLLRALELEKTEDLIGPLRLQTAEALLEIGFTAEARIYLDYYAAHRKNKVNLVLINGKLLKIK